MTLASLQFQCLSCAQLYPAEDIRYRCDCGHILDVVHRDWETPAVRALLNADTFDARLGSLDEPYTSGVWRFREIVAPIPLEHIVTKPEGNTNLYKAGAGESNGQAAVGHFAGVETLYLKHEGENPSGSFKDRGMTVGISVAHALGVRAVACASTGNTSAALASYAAKAGLPCFIFLPNQHVSSAKLSQTIAYGATPITIDGDFDTCMSAVEQVSVRQQIYLVNSINPFRVEGQKTIAYELLQQLRWQAPDWLVVPGGNLGNASAIGKALVELHTLGMIRSIPRLVVVQAHGANPFYQSFKDGLQTLNPVHADTLASAIRIGNPISFLRAKGAITTTNGIVEEVSDDEILQAKAVIDTAGIGCEPGSATTVAGVKKLVARGKIKSTDTVACILTGHLLKDPQASLLAHPTTPIEATIDTVEKTVARLLETT